MERQSTRVGAPVSAKRSGATTRRDESAALALGILPRLLGRQLRIAQSLIFKDFLLEVGGMSMTPGSFEAMELLEHNAGIGQTRLAAAISLDKSSLVPVLARLLALGLVERTSSASDKRANHLHLTDLGRSTLATMRSYVMRRDATITKGLTKAEIAKLNTLLKKLAMVNGYLADEAGASRALRVQRPTRKPPAAV